MGKIRVIMADPDRKADFYHEADRTEEVDRGITHLTSPAGLARTLCGAEDSWTWIDAPKGAAVTCPECWRAFSAIRSARGIKGVER
jgi:hypothetical protein